MKSINSMIMIVEDQHFVKVGDAQNKSRPCVIINEKVVVDEIEHKIALVGRFYSADKTLKNNRSRLKLLLVLNEKHPDRESFLDMGVKWKSELTNELIKSSDWRAFAPRVRLSKGQVEAIFSFLERDIKKAKKDIRRYLKKRK